MRQEGDHSIAEVGLPAKEDNDCHTSRALYSSFPKMLTIDQPSMDPRVVIPKRRMRRNHSVVDAFGGPTHGSAGAQPWAILRNRSAVKERRGPDPR